MKKMNELKVDGQLFIPLFFHFSEMQVTVFEMGDTLRGEVRD